VFDITSRKKGIYNSGTPSGYGGKDDRLSDPCYRLTRDSRALVGRLWYSLHGRYILSRNPTEAFSPRDMALELGKRSTREHGLLAASPANASISNMALLGGRILLAEMVGLSVGEGVEKGRVEK
jgi:hypothetical protein